MYEHVQWLGAEPWCVLLCACSTARTRGKCAGWAHIYFEEIFVVSASYQPYAAGGSELLRLRFFSCDALANSSFDGLCCASFADHCAYGFRCQVATATGCGCAYQSNIVDAACLRCTLCAETFAYSHRKAHDAQSRNVSHGVRPFEVWRTQREQLVALVGWMRRAMRCIRAAASA